VIGAIPPFFISIHKHPQPHPRVPGSSLLLFSSITIDSSSIVTPSKKFKSKETHRRSCCRQKQFSPEFLLLSKQIQIK
jgi:hypothetical protein